MRDNKLRMRVKLRLSLLFSPTGNNLDALHDITVAYLHTIPQTERHLLAGTFPRQIHFHIRRFPVSSLPQDNAALQAWCQERWVEKEERLRSFYTSQCFDKEEAQVPPRKRVTLIKVVSLCYWNVFIFLSFLAIWLYTPVLLYFLSAVIFFVVQLKLTGGVELMEMACHRRLKRREERGGEKKD